jgi:hypothetical protein
MGVAGGVRSIHEGFRDFLAGKAHGYCIELVVVYMITLVILWHENANIGAADVFGTLVLQRMYGDNFYFRICI